MRTALDLNLQWNAERAVKQSLRQYGRDYRTSQAAAVLMDSQGAVRAMVGGRDYGESQFNRATDALRQPGSSFKPYVYATALSNGFKPNSVVVDGPVCIGNWCPKNYSGGFSGAMTLTTALQRSINVIPVKLSIALGKGSPKAGRAKIREVARKAGLRTPLVDTPSMPIGANEVTVLDHTGGIAMFLNGGMSVTPHALLEVRSATGELIWRFDRDGPKPQEVVTPEVALEINAMLNKAAEEGTGRRAKLNGIHIAGKTGTTNAYRDAWFVGYTGNYVAGIWFGNDDYSVTNRLTGGSLPAMTWAQIMTYAHQGIELKPLPGVDRDTPVAGRRVIAPRSAQASEGPQRPPVLTRRGIDVLVNVERLLDDATRALADRGRTITLGATPSARPPSPKAVAAAPQQQPGDAIRGN